MHLVLGGPARSRVFVDGTPVGVVPVRGSRLYTLARLPTLQSRLLELPSARASGLRLHVRLSGALLLAGDVVAVLALAVTEELRELGRESVAGRQVRLLGERVRALLELLDVRRCVRIGGDRLETCSE